MLAEIQSDLSEVKPETNNPQSTNALRRAKGKVREAIVAAKQDDGIDWRKFN